MMDEYKTITKTSEGLYKEKGSKFIALAYPVQSEDEVKSILQGLRKEYYDARHHCYSYRLGPDKEKYRVNDDGEPSGSAGKPIHGQLLSFDLTDILIVVIRYFGGTKLGVAGLINAYRTAAKEAIESNKIIVKTVQVAVKINFDYIQLNDVMKIIKELNPKIHSQEFEMDCKMHLSIRKKVSEELLARLLKVKNLKVLESED